VSSVEPDLAAQAVRGGAVTVLTQGLRAATQLAGLIVLSRLLPPEDVGILAMVFVVTNLGDVIRDFGLSAAAVQAQNLTTDERSVLFWINAALGLLAALLAIAVAPLAADLLHEPRLTSVLRAVSVILLLSALGAQYQAHLNRALRFAALGWAEVCATVLGLLAAVAGVHAGMGYWALALQQLVQAAALALAMALLSGWLPAAPHHRHDVRRFVAYGSPLFGTQVLAYVTQNADNFVVGRRFGASALGPYSRAFQILILPVNQLSAPLLRVTLPVLSRIRSDEARYNAYLLRGQLVLGYAIAALLGLLAAVASPLFVMLMGHEWSGVAVPFRILAIGGAFQSMSFVCYWVFLSKALTRELFRYSLVSRAVGLALIVAGSAWGVNGVAAGVALGLAVSWPLSTWWLWRCHALSPPLLLRNGLRILIAGAIPACSGAWAGTLAADEWSSLGLGLAGWLVGAGLLGASASYRRDVRSLLQVGLRLRTPSDAGLDQRANSC
jgi:PST family polysaccharide transporter